MIYWFIAADILLLGVGLGCERVAENMMLEVVSTARFYKRLKVISFLQSTADCCYGAMVGVFIALLIFVILGA